MLVLVTYDVGGTKLGGQKRLRHIAETIRNRRKKWRVIKDMGNKERLRHGRDFRKGTDLIDPEILETLKTLGYIK